MGASFLELILAGDDAGVVGLSEQDHAELRRVALDVAPPATARELAGLADHPLRPVVGGWEHPGEPGGFHPSFADLFAGGLPFGGQPAPAGAAPIGATWAEHAADVEFGAGARHHDLGDPSPPPGGDPQHDDHGDGHHLEVGVHEGWPELPGSEHLHGTDQLHGADDHGEDWHLDPHGHGDGPGAEHHADHPPDLPGHLDH